MKGIKTFVKLTGLLLILILSVNSSLFASKFMASDFGWQKVGKDSFLITLTVYRDCNGASPGTAKIYFSRTSTSTVIDSLFISLPAGTEVTPVCSSTQTRCQSSASVFPYGIQRYIYQDMIYLKNAGNFCSITMSYYDTNRSNAITTIGDSTGMPTFYTEAVFNRCLSSDDHAPRFSNLPVEIICMGQDHRYNPGVIDNDKDTTGKLDSLVYDWTVPLSNYNDTIPYNGSYSYKMPIWFWGFPNTALPFPRGIHLDYKTGDLQYRPMRDEVTVMAISVKEFRNGQLIGEVRREMLVIVMNCANNNPPSITTPGNVRSKTVCAGDTVVFDFSTTDPNSADTVTISWNNAIAAASFTSNSGLVRRPTATFSWATTSTDVSGVAYSFSVTAKDNACPIAGSFNQSYNITVRPKPQASFSANDSGCGLYYFNAQLISGSGAVYSWQGGNYFTFQPNTGNAVQHTFKPGDTYPYTMTVMANGCYTTYFDTVTTDTYLWVELPPDTSVCQGSVISVRAKALNVTGKIHYLWNTSVADTFDTKTLKITRDTSLSVTVHDSSGCYQTGSISIKINPRADAGKDTGICIGSSALLTASGGVSYMWSTGQSTQTIQVAPTISKYYKVQVTDSNSCKAVDSVLVSVVKVSAGNDTTICLSPLRFYPLKGSPDNINGLWTGQGVNQAPNLKWYFGLVPNGKHQLIYYYNDPKGCRNNDTVVITVKGASINIDTSDLAVCEGKAITLTATHSMADSILWMTGPAADGHFIGKTSQNPISYIPGTSDLKKGGFTIMAKTFNPICESVYDTVFVKASYQPEVDFTASPLTGSVPLLVYFYNDSALIKGINQSCLWHFGDGTTSDHALPTHIYYQSGSFNVKLVAVVDGRCADSNTRVNYITTYVGISNGKAGGRLSFYPNPAHSELNIDNLLNEPAQLMLSDIYGKTLLETRITSGINTINIRHFKPGIYFIFVNGTVAGKVLIE